MRTIERSCLIMNIVCSCFITSHGITMAHDACWILTCKPFMTGPAGMAPADQTTDTAHNPDRLSRDYHNPSATWPPISFHQNRNPNTVSVSFMTIILCINASQYSLTSPSSPRCQFRYISSEIQKQTHECEDVESLLGSTRKQSC